MSRIGHWLAVSLCTVTGALSAPLPASVNGESPPAVSEVVEEWTWLWDAQTEVGEFDVPSTHYDRRHGRTYARGQTTVRYQLRIPEDRDRIRGVLVLVSGLDQHSGRYRYLVERLRDEFIIAACDTRFMGRSNPAVADLEPGEAPPRGMHRGLRSIRKFFYLIYDLDKFVQEILPRDLAEEGLTFEEVPLVLFGHSLGGLILLDYVLGNDFNLPPENLAGVILSSPALRSPPSASNWFQGLIINYNFDVNASFGSDTEQRTLFFVLYEQTRNIVMTPLFYLISLTRIPVDSTWASPWVTDDPWEQIGFQTDPLTIRRNPMNFVYQVQEHMIELRDLQRSMTSPYLLFYSPRDRIVSPTGAEEFVERSFANHPLNRVEAVGESHAHELFRARPVVRDRLLATVEEWLDTLLGAAPRE